MIVIIPAAILKFEKFLEKMEIADKRIGDYTIQKRLGSGSFGSVYLCTKQNSVIKYAVKMVPKDDEKQVKVLSNGIKILQILNSTLLDQNIPIGSEYIVQLLEVTESPKYLGAVLEFADGLELFDYILNNHIIVNGQALGLAEPVAKRIVKQLLQGCLF